MSGPPTEKPCQLQRSKTDARPSQFAFLTTTWNWLRLAASTEKGWSCIQTSNEMGGASMKLNETLKMRSMACMLICAMALFGCDDDSSSGGTRCRRCRWCRRCAGGAGGAGGGAAMPVSFDDFMAALAAAQCQGFADCCDLDEAAVARCEGLLGYDVAQQYDSTNYDEALGGQCLQHYSRF